MITLRDACTEDAAMLYEWHDLATLDSMGIRTKLRWEKFHWDYTCNYFDIRPPQIAMVWELPVAFIRYQKFRSRPGLRVTLIVDPSMRNAGIGKKTIVKVVRDNADTPLWAEIQANNVAARTIYTRAGFTSEFSYRRRFSDGILRRFEVFVCMPEAFADDGDKYKILTARKVLPRPTALINGLPGPGRESRNNSKW